MTAGNQPQSHGQTSGQGDMHSGNRTGDGANRTGGRAGEAPELSDLMDIVRNEVKREVKAVSDKAGEFVQRGKEAAVDAGERMTDCVRERPLTSVAVAAGVGLLVGLMLGRRSGD